MQAPQTPGPKKSGVLRGVIILALTFGIGGIALFGSFYGIRAGFGSPVGGKCEDVLGCKPDATCIGKR